MNTFTLIFPKYLINSMPKRLSHTKTIFRTKNSCKANWMKWKGEVKDVGCDLICQTWIKHKWINFNDIFQSKWFLWGHIVSRLYVSFKIVRGWLDYWVTLWYEKTDLLLVFDQIKKKTLAGMYHHQIGLCVTILHIKCTNQHDQTLYGDMIKKWLVIK